MPRKPLYSGLAAFSIFGVDAPREGWRLVASGMPRGAPLSSGSWNKCGRQRSSRNRSMARPTRLSVSARSPPFPPGPPFPLALAGPSGNLFGGGQGGFLRAPASPVGGICRLAARRQRLFGPTPHFYSPPLPVMRKNFPGSAGLAGCRGPARLHAGVAPLRSANAPPLAAGGPLRRPPVARPLPFGNRRALPPARLQRVLPAGGLRRAAARRCVRPRAPLRAARSRALYRTRVRKKILSNRKRLI